jgi:hypothetical protein
MGLPETARLPKKVSRLHRPNFFQEESSWGGSPVVLLCALVILTTSDRTGPAGPGSAPSAGRAGASRPASVGVPIIEEVLVRGLEATLAWTWSDPSHWDRVSFRVYASRRESYTGRMSPEWLVSDEALDPAPVASAGATVRGSVTYRVPGEGLYVFRIEVLADGHDALLGRGFGHETSLRAWQSRKVMVGRHEWTAVPLTGTGGGFVHDAWGPTFSVFFELYHGPTLVRDCDLPFQIRWPGRVHGVDCDWETGERSVILGNPRPGSPGTWNLELVWRADGEPFARVDLESGRLGR